MSEGKVREIEQDVDHSPNDPLSASTADEDNGEQRDQPSSDAHTPPPDDTNSPTKLDSEDNRIIWKWLTLTRGKDPTPTTMAPARGYDPSHKAVEVATARGSQRLVAMKRTRKTKASATTSSVAPAGAHASSSSQAGQVVFVTATQASSSSQAAPPSQVVSAQAVLSSQGIAGHGAQHSQGTAGPSSHASPSHFVAYHTDHDSDSSSSIQGSCNKFLDRICFPRGHYHDD